VADYTVSYQSGLTIYSLVFDPSGNAWNGSAFVDRSANWALCSMPMTDDGAGTYSGSMPASLASGTYLVQSYLQITATPLETDNIVGTGNVEWQNSASSSPVDLATGSFVAQVLAAGGVTLTAAQSAILGSLITAASREMIRAMGNRLFPLATLTEIVTPEGGRQDRGEPASATLSQFPIQDVVSIMTGRGGVLTIKNVDTTTNQIATVAFTLTGDVEWLDLTYTGLKLSRMASGVTTTNTVTFAANVTLNALATAINALGGGWNATVQSNYGLWPSASLVGVREPKNALSNGACLDMFTQAASSCDIDRPTGILRCYGWGGNGAGGWGAFGDPWGAGFDGMGGYGGGGAFGWGQYRVQYQAGWATIPESLQLVAAEVVKLMFARLNSDPSLQSETADKYTWAAKASLANLSDDMMRTLMYYKEWRV
jgi:hypothetical protein